MLQRSFRQLASLCTTLWVGGMWVVAYLVVPVLFRALPDRQLAGRLAGEMFTAMAYVGVGCALYLLAYQLHQFKRSVWQQKAFRVTLMMLLLLLIGQLAIQPVMAGLKSQVWPLDVMQSALAAQFKLWHGLASVLYLMQSLLGIVLAADPGPKKNV